MKLWVIGLALVACTARAQPSSVERGRTLVANRAASQCLLCHSAPLPDPHTHGNLAPPLAGVGARLSAAELRERLVNPAKFNPQSIMPSYGQPSRGERVAASFEGKPIFTPEQLDDVIAYLGSLK
jgi:L-cysteine S-thiosulfotransferase